MPVARSSTRSERLSAVASIPVSAVCDRTVYGNRSNAKFGTVAWICAGRPSADRVIPIVPLGRGYRCSLFEQKLVHRSESGSQSDPGPGEIRVRVRVGS